MAEIININGVFDAQAGILDEMMNDMMDSTMDEDIEEETEEEVDKVGSPSHHSESSASP